MSYEILDHTADIGLKSRSDSLSEVFCDCARGMFSLLVAGTIENQQKILVSIQADSAEELLHDWLSELNYLFLVKQNVFQDFSIVNMDESKLEAVCFGEKYDGSRHSCDMEIKAVTYHQIQVQKSQDCWIAQVFFDL